MSANWIECPECGEQNAYDDGEEMIYCSQCGGEIYTQEYDPGKEADK